MNNSGFIVAVKVGSEWTIVLETDSENEARQAFALAVPRIVDRTYQAILWCPAEQYEVRIAQDRVNVATVGSA